jgi:hypothetical protein
LGREFSEEAEQKRQKSVFQILMSQQLSLIRDIPDSGKTTTSGSDREVLK